MTSKQALLSRYVRRCFRDDKEPRFTQIIFIRRPKLSLSVFTI